MGGEGNGMVSRSTESNSSAQTVFCSCVYIDTPLRLGGWVCMWVGGWVCPFPLPLFVLHIIPQVIGYKIL